MANVNTTFRAGPSQGRLPVIYNLAMALANTEYSQALSQGTKKITVRMRVNASAKMAFVSGDTSILYVTLNPGTVFVEENLNLDGVTIYLQSNQPGQVAEILEWT